MLPPEGTEACSYAATFLHGPATGLRLDFGQAEPPHPLALTAPVTTPAEGSFGTIRVLTQRWPGFIDDSPRVDPDEAWDDCPRSDRPGAGESTTDSDGPGGATGICKWSSEYAKGVKRVDSPYRWPCSKSVYKYLEAPPSLYR